MPDTAKAEPAIWGRRRRILDVLNRFRLAAPTVRGYELLIAAKSRLRAKDLPVGDGLPLPPARLRAQVGPAHVEADFFLRSGREQVDIVRTLLAEAGTPVDELDALLDWGCGCGRILRHWSHLTRTRIAGCDINAEMVAWCEENLPFADVTVNSLEPPLPYSDETFDLVYGFSVMTHLSVELQNAWSAECFRILKGGGYFLFSTLGDHYLSLGRLTDEERDRFAHGDVVVLYEGSPGTSLCSAYHPPSYVREKLAPGFDFVSFRPAIDYGRHDVHVFRKP